MRCQSHSGGGQKQRQHDQRANSVGPVDRVRDGALAHLLTVEAATPSHEGSREARP